MTFDEQNLEKKFLTVNNSQESIQTFSLWILHHRNHHKKIIQMWLKMLEKDKPSYRLTLFYLANDVIQHAKKKNYRQYLDGFQEVLKRATVFVKDEKIIQKISRVFSIWLERNIYPADFINELKDILQSTHPTIQNETTMKIVSEFKLSDLETKLQKVQKSVTLTQNSINNINIAKIDSLNNEVLSQLKDKSSGEQYCKEFDEIEKVLQNAIIAIENEVSARATFLTLLEKAKIYYEMQKSEVKIVANAYKNFSNRVKAVKNKLLDSPYQIPHQSPSIDAPSPTISDEGLILPRSDSPLPGLKTLLDVLSENSSKKNKISSLDKRLSNLMKNIPSSIIQENSKIVKEVNLQSNTSLLNSYSNTSNINISEQNTKIEQNWSASSNNDFVNHQQHQMFVHPNLIQNIPENNFYSGYPPPPPPPPIEDYYQNHNNSLSYQGDNLNEQNSFKDNACIQQIKSVISTRNNDELNLNNKSNINFDPFVNHSNLNLLNHFTHENFEPSDMDLDNSDEEDNMNRSQNSQRVLKVIETSNNTNGNFSNKQIKSQIHHTIQPNLNHNLTSLTQTISPLLNIQTTNNNYHNGKPKQFYSPGKSFHHDNRNSRWSNNHNVPITNNLNNAHAKSHLQSIAVASTSHSTLPSYGNNSNRPMRQQHSHNNHNYNSNNNSNNVSRPWKNNQNRSNNRNRGFF